MSIEAEVEALFAEHRAPLLHTMHRMGLSLGESEDVVQEAFLTLLLHLVDHQPPDDPRAWIFRSALAVVRERRSSRAPVYVEAKVSDPGANPEQRAAWGDRHKRLQALVCAMPERDRDCLKLWAGGLGYRQIAEARGISVGAVAAALKRSHGELRTWINGDRRHQWRRSIQTHR